MNPYQIERQQLIDRLISQYPYGRKWFETKSNHVLIALLKKADTRYIKPKNQPLQAQRLVR
jgi:hypothetical protein